MADSKEIEAEKSAAGQSDAPAPAAAPAPAPAPAPGRRSALRVMAGVGAATCAAAIGVPAVDFSLRDAAGASRGGERWIRVGKLDDLKEGVHTRLAVVDDVRDAYTLRRDQVLGMVWIKREGKDVSALSATCPHLGCAISLAAGGKQFTCPCHSARFELDGTAVKGPSPRAMDPLETRVVEGFVEVDYRRYRNGIETREEA